MSMPLILGRPGDPQPKVSVLIKSYNHAAYVRRTIESVLGQSFQDFEIVVTDDASTDETADVVRSYKDTRIKLEVSPVNLGISGAMNATIARARGRYLAILNSDDWALPDRLRRQAAFLDGAGDVSLVFGLPRFVGENDQWIEGSFDFTVPLRFPNMSRAMWLWYFFYHGNCLSAPTAMIRREAYRAVGPYDRRLTNLQDMDMWIRMLVAGHEIHLLDEEVTAVRIRDNNANMSAPTWEKKNRGAFEFCKVLEQYAAMDESLLQRVFGDALNSGVHSKGKPIPMRLAELAAADSRRVYHGLALNWIYQHASDQGDFDWLRDLSASLDPSGWLVLSER